MMKHRQNKGRKEERIYEKETKKITVKPKMTMKNKLFKMSIKEKQESIIKKKKIKLEQRKRKIIKL